MKRKVHGPRRALRWFRNIVFGVVGFVGFVLIAAYLVFQTGWGRNLLRSQIEAKMSDTFIGGAKIGAIRGNPLTELILDDVVINGPDKTQAIKVKHLTVKLPILPLISHQLRVDKVIADELDLTIKKGPDGQVNLANLMKKSEEKSTWSITLPNVEVHRGHIRSELGAEPMDLDDIELYVDAALPFAGPVDATVALSAKWRQKKAPIELGTDVHVDTDSIKVHQLGAIVADASLTIINLRVPKGSFEKPFGGVVSLYAPAKTVRDLSGQVDLPGDLGLLVVATPNGRMTHAKIDGVLAGAGTFDAVVDADAQLKLAHGYATGENLVLEKLSNGKIDGKGGAYVAFDVDGRDKGEFPTANALITAWGRAGKAPPTNAVISIAAKGDEVHAAIGAQSETGLRATINASVRKHGDAITLERGDVLAATADAKRASQGLAPIHGALSANLHASGSIKPNLDIAVAGYADGKNLRMQNMSARTFKLNVDAVHIPSAPAGSARLVLADARRDTLQIKNLTLAAGNRPDGKLQVSLRTAGTQNQSPMKVDLDALVTPGTTTTIDLQRHVVNAGGKGEWRGESGLLTISPRVISLVDFASSSGKGHIAATGSFVRAGRNAGDLDAVVDARIDLDKIEKTYQGHAEAHVDVTRKNGKLEGAILAKGTGFSLHPTAKSTFDADVKITAGQGKVYADVGFAAQKAGGARLTLDVDAPRDLADKTAWSKLGRTSIRTAAIVVDKLDLEKLADMFGAPPMKGSVDGKLELTPTSAGGDLAIRGVETKQTQDLGTIVADLKISESGPHELKTSLVARLVPLPAAVAAKDVTQDGAARFLANAQFQVPDKLFDVASWKALGANAFRGGEIRAERLAFQPGTLERLGIVSDLRGELAVGAELDPGMKAARFAVNVHGLRGGLFAQPIAATVSGVLDEKSSRVIASVHAKNITLLRVTGSIPMTLAEVRADPQAAKLAPLSAKATIANVPAVTLMNVLGTSQINGGTVDGNIDVGGTVAKPTVDAKLVARNVTVPREPGKATPGMKVLTVNANWDGAHGKVAIDGDQTNGGVLHVRAEGSPDELAKVTANIEAHRLDLAPLVAFMPGPAGGLGGQLDAKLGLRGADPTTADINGSLHITDGRIPIAPAVGTLFKGDVKLDVRKGALDVNLTGKLGRGDVRLKAHAPLEGATPKSGDLWLSLDKVQLIGTTEPIITGVVTANLARVDNQWRSNVRVDRMTVKVPKEKGTKLAPVGVPTDVVYGGEKIHHGVKHGKDVPGGLVHNHGEGVVATKEPSQVEGPVPNRKAPDVVVADVKIVIRNVFVESTEARGLVGGNLRATVGENKEVSLVGFITMSRGMLELFNRRYIVDKANLQFDGSVDPMLDVRITHDFPEVTTITEVRGRMSKPKLVLSSNPGQYTQAELLGFLLGGEPGGDPENAPSATSRVANAGASFLANKIAGPVKKALPVDIDVLRYESASSTSSAAVTVGTWITDTLFLAYRRHLEARPDENTGEGELEHWIRRRLVLEATAGDRGVNGADLLWRRRW